MRKQVNLNRSNGAKRGWIIRRMGKAVKNPKVEIKSNFIHPMDFGEEPCWPGEPPNKSVLEGCELVDVNVVYQEKNSLGIKIFPNSKLVKDMTIREIINLAENLKRVIIV